MNELLPFTVQLSDARGRPLALLASFACEGDAQNYCRGLASSGDYLEGTRFETAGLAYVVGIGRDWWVEDSEGRRLVA